ncbi:cGMP-dependent protein kinase [Temnothorax longispinosus]|uniref:cGMP-dependent protein kinase n=1 Tax=Temnothorax longispinosus TaxID=300112 RepID=A0A4S2JK02_9HYME|nr:cGMP-dependent protein kinase [Temnothorax longispinosus]
MTARSPKSETEIGWDSKLNIPKLIRTDQKLNEEFRDVRLQDLRIIATLDVGGFGRVELVQIAGDSTRSFALKQMKKAQIVETRQ